MPYEMKENVMSSYIFVATPTQVDVDRYIAQAHRMRGEYIARTCKSGLTFLRSLFARRGNSKAAAA